MTEQWRHAEKDRHSEKFFRDHLSLEKERASSARATPSSRVEQPGGILSFSVSVASHEIALGKSTSLRDIQRESRDTNDAVVGRVCVLIITEGFNYKFTRRTPLADRSI